MTPTDYYAECISIAAEECGLAMTQAQLKYLAEAVEGGAENISQAFGWDVASANRSAEIERDRGAGWKAAESERQKVHCRQCDGSGRERYYSGPWACDTQCGKCAGEGRHDP